MGETVWLTLAVVFVVAGLAWLALAMPVHWRQVQGTAGPGDKERIILRVLGTAGLVVSAGLCLLADRPSMAVLVWVMLLAGAAPLIGLTLAWRPHWLRILWPWGQTSHQPDGSRPSVGARLRDGAMVLGGFVGRYPRFWLAGPLTFLTAVLVMAGAAVWMPGGAAGVDNVVLPLVLFPLIWAVLFFYACLVKGVSRGFMVMGLLAMSQVGLIGLHLHG